MITEPAHSLLLGTLELTAFDVESQCTFEVHSAADGETDWGNPEPVVNVMSSFLADGDDESITRFGNVDTTIGLTIKGETLAQVAAGEARLEKELGDRNELIWTPPDGWGKPSVFEIVTSWSDHLFDDWDEINYRRAFRLNLRRAPWARSLEAITLTVAEPVTGTPVEPMQTTIVDSASGLTGWTAYNWDGQANDDPFIGGNGRVGIARSGTPSRAVARRLQLLYSPPAPIDLTADPLLMVEWNAYGAGASAALPIIVRLTSGETIVELTSASAQTTSPEGGVRTWFSLSGAPAGALASVTQIEADLNFSPTTGYTGLGVGEFSTWNLVPSSGSASQQFRSISVPGSVRTPASLQVWHESEGLGEALIWTGSSSSGYQPPCRQFRVAGGTVVTDPNRLSGAYEPLDAATPVTYDIPVAALPEGEYVALALLKGDAPGSQLVSWTAATRIGGEDMAETSGFASRSLTTNWAIYELGLVSLPTMLAVGEDAFVRIKVSSNGASDIDELLLMNVTDGTLTWASAGNGTPALGGPSSSLWIESPTLDRPRPSIWLGVNPDGSDRRHVTNSEVKAWGTHEFDGEGNVFVATSGAGSAGISLNLYPRWTHNAAL